jgi:hypothetical protein
MPTLTQNKPLRPMLPPEETLWQKYSAHHEFPLASIASLFVHSLVLGLMVFVAFVLNTSWHDEAAQPPRIDVVQLEGGEGMGNGPGPVGGSPEGDNRPRTELVESPSTPPSEFPPPNPMAAVMPPELAIPSITLEPDTSDPLDDLKRIEAEAAKVAAPKPPQTASASSQPIIKAGQNLGSGRGALGIGGKGPGGMGGGSGKTPNGSGMGGSGLTRQQWLANRWKFGLSGDPKMHLEKLVAVGVIYAFPAPTEAMRHPKALQQAYVIQDLKKRPVQPRLESFDKYRDAVLWINNDRDSVFRIAKELRLSYVPSYTLLLLPKDREQAIANEETRYLKEKGIAEQEVDYVEFDFRLRNGAIEPVAINHGKWR